MALETSPERPAPVRVISQAIGGWIDRLGTVWVEGQVAQLSRRPGARMTFLTLRDPSADLSMTATCAAHVLEAVQPRLEEGARVVVRARPSWYHPRGTLSLAVEEIRPVGLGELLARMERVRALLAAEGLFDVERKRALPFLPRAVGLICGRASAAERDVLTHVELRAPGTPVRVRTTAVQGPLAAAQMIEALAALDADPEVDVIVLARGGGSVEDLLPFSDEGMVRAVSVCRTPVVTAIGHESDHPLVDLAADIRASTPTDAAKQVVPDVAQERRRVGELRDRGTQAVANRIGTERHAVASLRGRPVLANPATVLLERERERLQVAQDRCRNAVVARLGTERLTVTHLGEQVRALSPQATLDRGYAIAQRLDGRVVRDAGTVQHGERLLLRLAAGQLGIAVREALPAEPTPPLTDEIADQTANQTADTTDGATS